MKTTQRSYVRPYSKMVDALDTLFNEINGNRVQKKNRTEKINKLLRLYVILFRFIGH